MSLRVPHAVLCVGILITLAVGCGALAVGGPTHVVLRFAPVPPTHFELVTTMTMEMSSSALTKVPAEKRRGRVTMRQALDFARPDDGEGYDVRIGIDEKIAPYTIRLSKAAVIIGVTPDAVTDAVAAPVAAGPGNQDLADATKNLLMLAGASNDLLGLWRVGESRLVTLPTLLGDRVVNVPATVTLRRIGTVGDRIAALFSQAVKAKRLPLVDGTEMDMTLAGEWWLDVATGLPLRGTVRARGTAPLGTSVLHIDMDITTEVDWAKTRGL